MEILPGGGIFEGVSTSMMIDLVLAGEQKQMSYSEDGYVWTAQDGQPYKDGLDHKAGKFLGYTFSSVTCGDETH